ncbi:MAG: STAS domain-containing protein [Ignavibacteriae bacterium]|nr:STAS domain-containing protein [Ignavibacteriota bacterium]
MKFEVQNDGTSVTLTLHEKKLDSTMASELKGEFLIIAKPKIDHLIIDLKEVEFCDSSGLSALLIAERKMKEHGGTVRLLNANQKVMSLLKISMLDRLFEFTEPPKPAAKKPEKAPEKKPEKKPAKAPAKKK